MKRIIIVGATSGIGKEVAMIYLKTDCRIGIAGRRTDALKELQAIAPDKIEIQPIDVTQEDATDNLLKLIEKTGGMDIFLLSSGIGNQNIELNQCGRFHKNGGYRFQLFQATWRRTPFGHQFHRRN